MIINAARMLDRRRASFSSDGKKEISETYVVTSDGDGDEIDDVITAAFAINEWDIDTPYDSPYDDAICVSIDPRALDEAGKVYEVEYRFSTPSAQQSSEGGENGERVEPESRPPQLSGGFVELEIVPDFDVEGDAIVNAVDDKFDPSPSISVFCPTLSYTRFENSSPESLTLTYANKINSGTFRGWAAGSVLCRGITWQLVYEKSPSGLDWSHYSVTYEFIFNPLPWKWKAKLLNQGFRYYKVASTPPAVPILDGSTKTSVPKNLALNGTLLGDSDPPTYIEFNLHESVDFSGLSLS